MDTSVIHQTKEELADLVWLKTGRTPILVRTQALLVISDFEDGTVAVHHIGDLER